MSLTTHSIYSQSNDTEPNKTLQSPNRSNGYLSTAEDTSCIFLATSSHSSSSTANHQPIHHDVSTSDVEKWQPSAIREWLESIGMLPTHIKNALKYLKNGRALLNLTENDLENVFFISNQMHKRKIKLALDELKHPSDKWYCGC
jgi:hypothetical protein